MTKRLLLVQKRNNVCTLVLNRPEKQNSLSIELIELLESTLKELAQDDAVRTVILRGGETKPFARDLISGLYPHPPKGI